MVRVTKSELARAAGVSYRTFQRWLASHREELHKRGVEPHSNYVSPRGVAYICKQYDIDPKELEDPLSPP